MYRRAMIQAIRKRAFARCGHVPNEVIASYPDLDRKGFVAGYTVGADPLRIWTAAAAWELQPIEPRSLRRGLTCQKPESLLISEPSRCAGEFGHCPRLWQDRLA
jgi:hypothetical protein